MDVIYWNKRIHIWMCAGRYDRLAISPNVENTKLPVYWEWFFFSAGLAAQRNLFRSPNSHTQAVIKLCKPAVQMPRDRTAKYIHRCSEPSKRTVWLVCGVILRYRHFRIWGSSDADHILRKSGKCSPDNRTGIQFPTQLSLNIAWTSTEVDLITLNKVGQTRQPQQHHQLSRSSV